MTAVHLPDELYQFIDRQIAAGRASSKSDFVIDAVQRYVASLDHDEPQIIAAGDEGIADVAAGRFTLIATQEDMHRLQTELSLALDRLEQGSSAATR